MTEHITGATVSTRELEGGPVAVVTLDNGEGRRPNTFGMAGLARFSAALDAVEGMVREGAVRGVIVTGKPGSFLAGADLNTFRGLADDSEAAAFPREGKAVFSRLKTLGVPAIAVVNGMALGGGLELALFCDHRVATDDARALGFPEAYLGLVPGWAGAYHLPRLVGPERALTVLVDNPLAGNRLLSPQDALELGVVDAVADSPDAVDAFVAKVLAGDVPERAPLDDQPFWDAALDARRPAVEALAAAGTRAVGYVLDLVDRARAGDEAASFRQETEYSREITMSDACRRSLYAFDLLGKRPRKPVDDAPDVTPVVEVLAAAIGDLPADLAGVSRAQLEPALAALRAAVARLIADGWTPAQIDTVALADLRWPLHFGGIIPLLDDGAETPILPPGTATVPPA